MYGLRVSRVIVKPEVRQLHKQVERVTIFGLGNVALDCARILLADSAALAATDIAAHALETLRLSAVRRVDLVGRRGAVQASAPADSPFLK